MNLRWLFFNFTDPQYKLSRADQKRLTMKAHSTFLPARHWWLMMLAPFVVMIGGFELVHTPLQTLLMMLGVPSTGFLPLIIWIGFVWVALTWAYRFIYIKPIRRAMLEEGYRICIKCGYDLRGADHESCPECGEEIRKGNPA